MTAKKIKERIDYLYFFSPNNIYKDSYEFIII